MHLVLMYVTKKCLIISVETMFRIYLFIDVIFGIRGDQYEGISISVLSALKSETIPDAHTRWLEILTHDTLTIVAISKLYLTCDLDKRNGTFFRVLCCF